MDRTAFLVIDHMSVQYIRLTLTGLFPSQLDNITTVFPQQEIGLVAHLAAYLVIVRSHALRAVLPLT